MHHHDTSPIICHVEGFAAYDTEAMSRSAVLHADNDVFTLKTGDTILRATVISFNPQEKKARIKINGSEYGVTLEEPIDRLIKELGFLQAAKHSVKEVRSPMPGMVVEVFVAEDEEVVEGQNLCSLEAMKMENIIKSPGAGKIKKLIAKKGLAVEKNQMLVLFE